MRRSLPPGISSSESAQYQSAILTVNEHVGNGMRDAFQVSLSMERCGMPASSKTSLTTWKPIDS